MTDWPPDFSKSRRLVLLREARYEFRNNLEWEEDVDEWYAHTDYSETLHIIKIGQNFQAVYILNGNWEDPVLDEKILGYYTSRLMAQMALANHVTYNWASWRAHEELAYAEMAEDQNNSNGGE